MMCEVSYRTDPRVDALYRSAAGMREDAFAVEGRFLPLFGDAGTGGVESPAFHRHRAGYHVFQLSRLGDDAAAQQKEPFVELMQIVKDGFGRTMSRLPEVFGVSRQTLYNWLAGEMPKDQHHARLHELAAAAKVFKELGFKPTSLSLDRTVADGKSLLQLLREGASGDGVARKLARISQRASRSRAELDAMLGARKPARLDAADMGTPSLPEDA